MRILIGLASVARTINNMLQLNMDAIPGMCLKKRWKFNN